MDTTVLFALTGVLTLILIIGGGGWFLHRSGLTSLSQSKLFSPSVFQIDHRRYVDPKRSLVQIRDQTYLYTILLGERDLLLDKRLLPDVSFDKHPPVSPAEKGFPHD